MYKRIHNQFGTAGMILSVVAIVLALAGGAVAASGGKPGPRGPRGKTGKTGPQGPQGLAGTNGTNGKDGANGTNGVDGTNGTDGTNGKTVLNGSATPTTQGVDGDFYVKTGASPEIFGPKTAGAWGAGTALKGTNGTNGNTVLNGTGAPSAGTGANGDFYIDTAASKIYGPKAAGTWPAGVDLKGPTGSPWTAGGTLPPNSTETGAWYGTTSASEELTVPLSFPIPLATAPAEVFVGAGAGQTSPATASTTTGSKKITGVGATVVFGVGLEVVVSGFPAGTIVEKRLATGEYELSNAATATAAGLTVKGVSPAACNDGAEPPASAAHPEADPGKLCVFGVRQYTGVIPVFLAQQAAGTTFGTSTAGALLAIAEGGVSKEYRGTFAVTG